MKHRINSMCLYGLFLVGAAIAISTISFAEVADSPLANSINTRTALLQSL